MSRQRGLTLVELIVALGISAVIILFTAHFVSQSTRMFSFIERTTGELVDEMIFKTILWEDLSMAGPSYGFLNSPSTGNGDVFISSRSEDVPIHCFSMETNEALPFWALTMQDFCERLEVVLENEEDEFTFITINPAAGGDSFLLDPRKYIESTFNASNFIGHLEELGMRNSDDQLLLIRSTSRQYERFPANQSLNHLMRDYGVLYNTRDENFPHQGLYTINSSHCDLADGATIFDMRNFHNCLSTHNLSLFQAYPIRIIRYYLEDRRREGEEFENLVVIREIQLANRIIKMPLMDHVKKIRFFRSNTTQPAVAFDVKRHQLSPSGRRME